jgi:hypothetical protein
MENKKKMEVIKNGKKNDVITFENRLNHFLPNDYKDFLSKYDGVRFYNCEFYIKDIDQRILMDVLYGVNGEKKYNICKKNERFLDELPNKSLAIGEDPGGTPILLVNDGENNGIYFFDSDCFFKQSSDEKNTYLIADTFTDFFNMLKVENIFYKE